MKRHWLAVSLLLAVAPASGQTLPERVQRLETETLLRETDELLRQRRDQAERRQRDIDDIRNLPPAELPYRPEPRPRVTIPVPGDPVR